MPDASAIHASHGRSDRPTLPFIGRDAELRVLNEALELALAGLRQVVLLGGEPGIGKTHTMSRLAEQARERGALVLWGNCYAWEGAPAYWPWTQALGAWLRDLDDAEITSTLASHATLLVQLVPELRERRPAHRPLPPLEPEARRFQLLAAVGGVIRAAAARRPLVIVLDDVHWADPSTLQLLLFLAQECRDVPVLLVATYRDVELGRRHPSAPLLADLMREPHSRRLILRGLPEPQVARLVALITGQAQSPGLVDAVYAETNGNPFFVAEVARLLAEEGHLDGGSSMGFRRSHVPESVREAIGRRLERLSRACNRALEVAAIVGRDFDVRVLERATGTSALDLLDALDEAVRARLINAGDAPGRFRFSHALVQETLVEETTSAERARLHLAVGQALETQTDREPPWAELAHHFYHAAPLGSPEKVATYGSRAGDAAMAQFAWEAAATHYQYALAAQRQIAPIDSASRCDLLLALGEAQNHAGSGAGDAPSARASFLQAFELARELGAGERMARAAVGYAGINIVAAFGGRRQLELLEAALLALEPTDSPLRVRVLARLAMDLWYRSTDNYERSRALAEQAVSAARRIGDSTLIAYALNARHGSGHRPDNLAARMADGAQLVIVAEQTGDPIAAAWGYLLKIMDDVEAGDVLEAEQALVALRQLDKRFRIPYVAQRVAVCRVMLDLLTGRYADAADQVERARVLWQSPEPRQHASQAFLLLRDLGRLDELTEEVQLPDQLHSWRSTAQAHRMALALERGQLALARADYESLVADDFARAPFNQHWHSTLAMLAAAAVAFHDAPRAARMVRWLEPYAERQVYDGSLGVCHGPVALYLGELASLLGHGSDATRWLQQSLAISERLGLLPYVARTLLVQAELLARRDQSGDRAAARDLAQRAIDVAESIGMLGLLPRATVLRDSLATSSAVPFGLTPRELDVLRAISQGLTDIEAAERLFLSPRTVGTHLTSIYTKLNVSSRTAAARTAIEHGLS